jgi:hypothetical protein
MDNLNALALGFIGGIIGALGMVGFFYYSFQEKYREYFFSKETYALKHKLNKALDDIDSLKMQVASINSNLFFNHD